MLKKIGIAIALLAVLCLAAFVAVFASGPLANTSLTHFDVIIVLGSPANADGSVSTDQRERVSEGIQEYRRGVAPMMILTGGAAHNRFVEARVMDDYAQSQGVPPQAIIEEPRARNTIQNAFYSAQIMQQRHWRSAEVVSSRAHIHRAALIFAHFPLLWRVHAAPWPRESSRLRIAVMYSAEMTKVFIIRVFGFTPSQFLPQQVR